MPLRAGKSKAAVRANIATLIREGRDSDQAVAISMRKAGKKRPKRTRLAEYVRDERRGD